MHVDTYSVEDIQLDQLIRSQIGFYSELLILNNTNHDVIITNNKNERTRLPPAAPIAISTKGITIFVRRTVGPTRTADCARGSIKGIKIFVPDRAYINEPCYIKEIDLLLSNTEIMDHTEHPYAQIEYDAALDVVLTELRHKIVDDPTFYIYANDPDNRCNNLYSSLAGRIITIPVTCHKGDAKIYISMSQSQGGATLEYDLDPLFESDTDILNLDDAPVWFVTTNRARAERYAKDCKRLTQMEVDKLIKQTEQQYTREITALKTTAALNLQDKDSLYKQVMIKQKELISELEQLQSKYDSLKGDLDYKAIRRKDDVTEKIAEHKLKETEYKLWHVIAAAAIPVIMTTIVKMVEMAIKR